MSIKFIKLIKYTSALCMFMVSSLIAAPYAAIVIDIDTGDILHEENADSRLHPAGLTKLMSLYVAFDAIEAGLVSLDDKVRISKKVEEEPPAKLGLRSGQQIKIRYLLRAAAVQGANDASTAIAESVYGSEKAFARRMNRFSKELGLTRSHWKNAHGLTQKGHLSTARDIATLFVAHQKNYPTHFKLFSRSKTDAGLREVANSSRYLLSNLKGIEGAKYGYTRASGFNSAALVKRGNDNIVIVVFGARSTATLNKRVAELADAGFLKLITK